jgi:hypothetical protein
MTAAEAKEFVISRIIAQAKRENVPLTSVEQEMLWWTEVHPEPHISDLKRLADRFDAECDSDEYEAKMAALLNAARANAPEDNERWVEAAKAIEREDHYLGVIFMQSGRGSPAGRLPIGNKFLLIVTILVVLIGLVAWIVRVRNP